MEGEGMMTLAETAASYCAARDHEKAIVRGLLPCTQVRRIIRYSRHDYEPIYDKPEKVNPGNAMCSRAMETIESYCGEYPEDQPICEEDWCPNCRANLPAVAELRKVRRSFGGLMSAMMRAWRRDQA